MVEIQKSNDRSIILTEFNSLSYSFSKWSFNSSNPRCCSCVEMICSSMKVRLVFGKNWDYIPNFSRNLRSGSAKSSPLMCSSYPFNMYSKNNLSSGMSLLVLISRSVSFFSHSSKYYKSDRIRTEEHKTAGWHLLATIPPTILMLQEDVATHAENQVTPDFSC